MLSPKNKRYLLQILPFGIINLVFVIIYAFIEKGILGDSSFYPSTGNPYSFNLLVPAIATTLFGLLFGLLEVLYINKWFQKSSFLKKIIFKTAIYVLITTGIIITIVIISNSFELGLHIFDPIVWNNLGRFLSDFAFWSIELYIALALVLSLFYTEVSDNIGQGVLLKFFTGKYHQPIVEERIFMFLDMKSSTTIAEKLGHVEYFKMLKEYYADLTDPIIQYAGEIYQYVGDEVVVTWKLDKGLKNHNCLKCFFAMKASLNSQAEKYEATYGLAPTFKAGIHLGTVTAGEIGVMKKEITFSGDVLNTAARIQSLCNAYKVDLLLSAQLNDALKPSGAFRAIELEETELKGRNEKITLFTIEES